MSEEILEELDVEGLRSIFLKYTREAFKGIPKIDNPRILDLGCGTGIVTLELARLSNGKITGIDIDENSLDKLNAKIQEGNLSDKIQVFNQSVYKTQFEDETFDIIWEEGVIHLLDFKKAITECKRLLKLNGYMISGEATNWAEKKLEKFQRFGFELVKKIPWAKECWWKEYYAPLEKKINVLRKKYDNIDVIEEIKRHLTEIEMVKKNTTGFECTTYILQKIE
ncbi:MAG: class I SAM-dependent methyltransferase [Candidatus Thorarchaeota archaeon]